jgi:hypothetical protein
VQLGTEDRRKTLIVSLGLLLAVLLFLWRMSDFFGGGSSTPDAAVTAAAPEPSAVAPGRRPSDGRRARPVLAATLDPRLRLDLLKSSEEVKYAGNGRNIFLSQSEPEIPKPVQSARLRNSQQEQQRPTVSLPPPPPPIQLKFYGFANKPGEPRRVFLAKGDDIFIAGEGDIVDRRYKVVRIGPTAIEVQDVLNPTNRQSIPITQG